MIVDVWRRLIRQPLVLVLLLVILVMAGLAGHSGWVRAGGQVESRSAVVIVPPWSLEDERFPNPMLNLGERATGLASALVVALQQRSDVADSVLGTGASSYELTNIGSDVRDPSRSAIIFITVTGPNEGAAHAGAATIIDQSRAVLKDMQEQAGTGASTYMASLQVISQPQETTTFALRQVRSAAALAAAVLIAGILLLWAVESMLERRARARDEAAGRREGQPSSPAGWNGHLEELNGDFRHLTPDHRDLPENLFRD
ncbi:MAG: hypothetical protein WBB07_08380 [Mycobacterium sp.]